MIGAAGGLIASSAFYLYKANVLGRVNEDEMTMLKKELVKELRQKPINTPKDADFTFPRDFMVYLFKTLYTYQTIGKEIVKEENFHKRISHYQNEDFAMYTDVVEKKVADLQNV